MENFREISEKTARTIDKAMLEISSVETLTELQERFIEVSGKLLPAEYTCWNNWKKDWSGMIDFSTNQANDPLKEMMDVFANVVGHHPVIAAGQFQTIAEDALRMSDFQTYAAFRDNPLFQEVYRHLDSHYQICFSPCELEDRRIILTWNRRALDFTAREVQILHYMGLRLAVIARRVEEREHLGGAWNKLRGFVDSRFHSGSVATLGERDGKLLAELLKFNSRDEIASGMGVRRDTVDKRLGAIREKLGLENHHQLLSALRDLGPRPSGPSIRSNRGG